MSRAINDTPTVLARALCLTPRDAARPLLYYATIKYWRIEHALCAYCPQVDILSEPRNHTVHDSTACPAYAMICALDLRLMYAALVKVDLLRHPSALISILPWPDATKPSAVSHSVLASTQHDPLCD